MDGNNRFHTFFNTTTAKRMSQIRSAVDKFNQSTDKRMNLIVDEDGLDMIVIFPGRTNHRENELYKQIAIAKTTSNPTYWSWQMAEAQVKKEDVVMADTPTSVVAPSPAALTVVPVADSTMVPVADSTMVAVETSTSMTTPASQLDLLCENELVHMENDDLNRRFAVLNAEHTAAVDNLKTANVMAKDREAEYATLSADFEVMKNHLGSLVHDDATGGYKDGAVKDASTWKVLKDNVALRKELDKAFEDLAAMQTMRNDSVECCKTLREKLNKHEPPRKIQVVLADPADPRKRMTEEETKVFLQRLKRYCANHDGSTGDLGAPLPARDAKYENMMPTLTEMMKKLKVNQKGLKPAMTDGMQELYDSLAKQLCQARDELCKVTNDYDAVKLQLACGTNSAALDGYRQKLLLRKMGDAAPPVPVDVLGLVVSELEEKCAECKALEECNGRLCADMGPTLTNARSMAQSIASRAVSDDRKALRDQIQKMDLGMLRLKQEYEWEYTRRQEYMRELVKMRDLTYLQDFELKTVKEIFDISYGKPTDLTKVPREHLIARLQMTENMCWTGYMDKYIEDRNSRIGLALTNVREWSVRVSERDAKIQELARTVRRLERLGERTGAEVEKANITKFQAEEEALNGRCESLRVEVRSLETKEMDARALCFEVKGDAESMRGELFSSRRELAKNQSQVTQFQAELDRLTKAVIEKQKECTDIEATLSNVKGSKEYAEFQKLVMEINRARDKLLSAQRECADKLEESKELDAEKILLGRTIEKLEAKVVEYSKTVKAAAVAAK